jgi:hypothetical protein
VEGGENVVCTSCHDGCCVALVHDAHGAAVWCLKCASGISIGPTLTVHVARRLGELEDLAREFEAALATEPMPGALTALCPRYPCHAMLLRQPQSAHAATKW